LASPAGNVFATWEWAVTWWKHFGRGRPLLLRVCRRDDGAAAAVLPLYLARQRPLRLVRLVGHGPADELGPVTPPAEVTTAARALRTAIAELPCDLFLGEQLPGGNDWGGLLGGSTLRREASPRLHASEGWGAFLASCSANLRQQIGRRERRLRSEHRVRFRLCDDPERLPQDLSTLFALHRAARPRTDFGPDDFHREFAGLALGRGWLRFWLLELDGRPASAWYGFRFGGAETYYQAGRDPAADRLSVGFVLLVHTIRAALEDGIREYRFGRGPESYKYRFASEDPGVETVAVTSSRLASLAVTGALEARRISRLLRRA
jgi:CelD/BcsL family acetyltransferase involved in cellulose biosynthesis